MMFLHEWITKTRVRASHFDGAKVMIVPYLPTHPLYSELLHLRDYRVSSVVAGTVWLTRR